MTMRPRKGPQTYGEFMLELIFYLTSYLVSNSCPNDMVKVADFCIDVYEAPNIKGQHPLVMQSLVDAEKWCSEYGKRVCLEEEWDRACQSTDGRKWSRGHSPDRTTCNNGYQWTPFDMPRFADRSTQDREVQRLYRGAPAGSYAECHTPEGVFDLDGNVEEWTVAKPGRDNRGTLKGGFWAKPWTTCLGSNDAHEDTFRFYETGFRCCL